MTNLNELTETVISSLSGLDDNQIENYIALLKAQIDTAKSFKTLRNHPVIKVIASEPGKGRAFLAEATGAKPDQNFTNLLLECKRLGLIESRGNKRACVWYVAGAAPAGEPDAAETMTEGEGI